jgi:acid stress chaperone HdeB
MKILRAGLTALMCSALAIVQAQGQVTVDVSKITCREFRSYSITDPNNIALWLSGYYNGQRGNTILNVSALQANLEKLKDYCITSPTITVMQAVEAIFGKP